MENTNKEKTVIKISKAQPMLTVSFYMEYQNRILNEFKYDNSLRLIKAFYDRTSSQASFYRFEDFSFDLSKFYQKSGKLFYLNGLIAHYSTIEGLNNVSNYEEIINFINKHNSEEKHEKISFILFIFGDLKNYIFSYSLVELNYNLDHKIKKITKFSTLSDSIQKGISEAIHDSFRNKENEVLEYFSNEIIQLENEYYLIIKDINSNQTLIPSMISPSLAHNYSINNHNKINVVLIKDHLNKEIEFVNTIIANIELHTIQLKPVFSSKNLTIKKVDLKQIFNPLSIAENAVDLNINLMKWRMAPDLDVNIIKKKNFLLVGAGTLGCHVARSLLGWGARNVNFIDCGKVSYSNPVRQSLYSFEDSSSDNFKATLAAKRLKEIFPMVNSEGYNLQIPLPSRTLIDQKAEDSFFKNINQLDKLISENDVIFLLTDSRESRWFPTVIAKHHNKTVITAAIGFDSFLVMRHGQNSEFLEKNIGCYFCNDIVSPIDTSINRTLDQQCTISRPGISSICSGFACELAISILQRYNNISGFLPQTIRGNLSDYNFMFLEQPLFKNCVACSENILNEYSKNREEFLRNSMNDPYYLEKVSGVSELISDIKLEDIEVDEDEF